MKISDAELLPCPLCGTGAVFYKDDEWNCWGVICSNGACACELPRRESVESAFTTWNTRPVAVAPAAQEPIQTPEQLAHMVATAPVQHDLIERMRSNADGLRHGQAETVDGAIGTLYEAIDRIEQLEVQTAPRVMALARFAAIMAHTDDDRSRLEWLRNYSEMTIHEPILNLGKLGEGRDWLITDVLGEIGQGRTLRDAIDAAMKSAWDARTQLAAPVAAQEPNQMLTVVQMEELIVEQASRIADLEAQLAAAPAADGAQGERQPEPTKFVFYADEDECTGETMPEYLKHRNENEGMDAWEIGHEFDVDAVYARREKWRVVNDVTFKAERVE